ncbi:2-phosphosulfolactate phosphatase [candidate division KSB1 bacterium]|nr:2-phosphosulfolactate phosphatase [candidate division KSB1 bacterium]
MVQVDVYLTPEEFLPENLRDRMAITIDVLRASTTLTTALNNGCSQIIPVAEVETARALVRQQSKSTTLLCGERGGRRISGFHLGNSPREYTSEVVRNKTLIFTSTNGSRLLTRTKFAESSSIASFLNAEIVTQHLLNSKNEVAILCAGKEDKFSLEDTVCAGLFVAKLFEVQHEALVMNDAALAAMVLYNRFGHDLHKLLRISSHGRYLRSIGLGDDLVICANLNSVNIFPVFKGGILSLHKSLEQDEKNILR